MILGLSGSPRKNGNTDVPLSMFVKGARDIGAAVETIYLRDYVIQPCIGCEQCRKDKIRTRLFDGMQLLYPKIPAARGIILEAMSMPLEALGFDVVEKFPVTGYYC